MSHNYIRLPNPLAICLSLVAAFACCPLHAQSLVGFWEAEGDATATVGANGTLQGATGFAAGQFGQGFDFSGAATLDHVTVPGGGGLDGATQGTISMWVQWNGTQDAACCSGVFGNVLSRQSNGVFSDNIIGLNNADPNAGGVTWQPFGAPAPVVITGGTAVGDGTMRHVAVSFSDGHHALYLDGVLQGNATTTGTMNSNPAVDLSIGAWNGDGSGYSTSVVDDVAIFNRELSAAQIQSLATTAARPTDVVDPIAGVTATASSELGAPFNRVAGNTVDGVGRTTVIPDGNPGQGVGMWLSEGIGFGGPGDDPDPQITFDLGAPTDIGEMVVYNYNEVNLTGRGVNEFEILVSLDDILYTSLGTQTLLEAPGDGTNPGQSFDLDTTAQYVRFDIISNYNGADFSLVNPGGTDFAFVGLNEVEFFEAIVIPEPTSLATWIVAGLMFGLAVWRNRKRKP